MTEQDKYTAAVECGAAGLDHGTEKYNRWNGCVAEECRGDSLKHI